MLWFGHILQIPSYLQAITVGIHLQEFFYTIDVLCFQYTLCVVEKHGHVSENVSTLLYMYVYLQKSFFKYHILKYIWQLVREC